MKPPEIKRRASVLRKRGWSLKAIERQLKVEFPEGYPSYNTLINWFKDEREKVAAPKGKAGDGGSHYTKVNAAKDAPAPETLGSEPAKALEDFAYFQRRYFGRIATPWQEEAAARVVEFLADPEESYCVINASPGSGKSTCFTLDIPAWITCRNRAIRGLMGSLTISQAKWYLNRLKRELERNVPLRAEERMKALGLALDAEATLLGDFGQFRPQGEDRDVWRSDEFVVLQSDGTRISEKESTWSAMGKDSAFLGARYDICIWDDVVDPKNMRSLESREEMFNWWHDYAETRLEPGGVLILQGQRINGDDLYRHALDTLLGEDQDDNEDLVVYDENGNVIVATEGKRKYHHIKFKAHYDELCTGQHSLSAPAYGNGGCLLVPRRLSYKKLSTIKRNQPTTYEVMYQQEESSVEDVLVDPLWVSGGRGNNGVVYPGCWDSYRDLCELPRGLTGDLLSVATVDPSPTRFWAIEWWVYHPDSESRFLMDLIRQKMDAPTFLNYDPMQHSYSGVMEEWQARSRELSVPITHWIVEANAAERFMLQTDYMRQWCAKNGVDLMRHETHKNKSDPNYGVQTMGEHWRWGRVRLPGKPAGLGQPAPGRTAALKLVSEVTRWPHATYDDCVMAEWFFEYNLPNIYVPASSFAPKQWRPTWMAAAPRTLAA